MYVARSLIFWWSMCRAGVADFLGVEEVRGEGWERAVSSLAVGARRTIFLETRVERGRDGKGDLRRPVLGVMRSFWFRGGMERVVWMEAARSVRVQF